MKRFLFVILGGLLAPLLGVLFTSSYASAASVYDGIIKMTDNISTSCAVDNSNLTDWGMTWASYIRDPDNYEPAHVSYINTAIDLLDENLDVAPGNLGSGWFVVQVSSYEVSIGIYDPSEVTPELVMHDYGGNYIVPALRFTGADPYSNFYTLSIAHYACNEPVVMAGGDLSITTQDTPWEFLFIADDIVYPPDYAGIIVPDTWEPPVSFDTETITIEWNSDDNKLNIRDTTDYYEGFTQCFIQLPVNKQGDHFTEYHYDCQVKPWIEHELPEIDQQFTAIVWVKVNDEWFSKSFTLPLKAGEKCNSELGCESDMLNNLLNDCLSTSFPFIHIDECGNFFYYLSNQLTFDRFNIGGIWTTGATCRQLGTIGNWMHRPNQTICPQFSKEVRDTVTPFITFMLGLLTVRFIISKTGIGN